MVLKLAGIRSALEGNRLRVSLGFCTAAFAVAALLISLVPLALAATPSFPDVPAYHPYHQAIIDLASRGIVSGYANGDFGPGDEVMRQQFAKMVVLTGGYAVSEANVCFFADVERSDNSSLYPDNYIAVCAANGITTGRTSTTFDPLASITRLQVVTMVVRMADNLRPGLLAAPSAAWSGNAAWAGDATHGANARRAEYNGLLGGIDLSVLSPTGNMKRGEVAQVLHNLLGLLGDSSGTTATTSATTTTTSPETTTTTSSTTTTLPTLTVDSDYEQLGGLLTSAPAACSWGEGRVDVFVRGIEGALWRKWWGPAGWSEWINLGGIVLEGTDPTAVAWKDSKGNGHIEVFVISLNDTVWHRRLDGASWSPWQEIKPTPGSHGTTMGVCVQWSGLVTLVVGYPGSSLYLAANILGDPAGVPSTVMNLGGAMKAGSTPAAIGGHYDSLEVFVRGVDDNLHHKWLHSDPFYHGKWSVWTSRGDGLTSSPAACRHNGRLEVFARRADNFLYQKSEGLSETDWSGWKLVASEIVTSSPAVASPGSNRLDVFVRGTDYALWHKWWDGTKWLP